jgi:hypothetical protein
MTANFSTQTLNTKKAWNDIFQDLKENSYQPRLVYPAKLSFTIEREIKTFQDKQKLQEYMTCASVEGVLFFAPSLVGVSFLSHSLLVITEPNWA